MHKFFCNYNNLTERYELMSNNRNVFRNNAQIQAENTLLPKVRDDIQSLYENIVLLKEKEKDEERLGILDETELLISNLYYSLFASPLELVEGNEKTEATYNKCKELIYELLKFINIPEYSRLCELIKNNIERLS